MFLDEDKGENNTNCELDGNFEWDEEDGGLISLIGLLEVLLILPCSQYKTHVRYLAENTCFMRPPSPRSDIAEKKHCFMSEYALYQSHALCAR